MFFLEYLVFAWAFVALLLLVVVLAALVLKNIKHFIVALYVAAVGVMMFFGLMWWGFEPVAQFVPWLIALYIFVEVILPVMIVSFDFPWRESEAEKNLRISYGRDLGCFKG